MSRLKKNDVLAAARLPTLRMLPPTKFLVFLLLISLLTGCGEAEPAVRPPVLRIDGDVAEIRILSDQADLEAKESVDFEEETHDAIPLSVLLEEESQGTFFFLGRDGFRTAIDAADAGVCYVTFHPEKGWCLIAPSHPVSTNVKDLESIILVSENAETGLLIDPGNDAPARRFSRGSLLTGPLTVYPKEEGSAEIETDGTLFQSHVYTLEKGFTLHNLGISDPGRPFILLTADGERCLTAGNGYFVLGETTIRYREEGGELYEDIVEIQMR